MFKVRFVKVVRTLVTKAVRTLVIGIKSEDLRYIYLKFFIQIFYLIKDLKKNTIILVILFYYHSKSRKNKKIG